MATGRSALSALSAGTARKAAPRALRAEPELIDFVRRAGVSAEGSRGPLNGAAAANAREIAASRTVLPIYGGGPPIKGRAFKPMGRRHIKRILERYAPAIAGQWASYVAAASILPMRTNEYVLEELIDWGNVPDDPIFKLVFPQPEMIEPAGLEAVRALVLAGASKTETRDAVRPIREALNPHPAGQKTMNVPRVDGVEVPGLQHKYAETVLHFPAAGQYCQSFCTYCFRFAQFVGDENLQFASSEASLLHAYLASNKQVSDLLITGGDASVLLSHELRRIVKPMLEDPAFEHLTSVRLGTKALAYHPHRFITDHDADDFLRVVEEVTAAGKHLSIMAHFTHPVELSTPAVQEAIRRLRNAGAQVRTQAPLVRNINDSAELWADMWRKQVALGCVPYYFFVERDTGAAEYFAVPLVEAHDIYRRAVTKVGGLARTVRGPSMSCGPGKVQMLGTSTVAGERVIALQFLQARNPDWAYRPFFAKYDDKAVWLSGLRPAFGEEKFFFEDELAAMESAGVSSGQAAYASAQC